MFKIKNIFGKKKDQAAEQTQSQRLEEKPLQTTQRQGKVQDDRLAATQQQNGYVDTKIAINIAGSESDMDGDGYPSIPIDVPYSNSRELNRSASMSGTTKVSSRRSLSDGLNKKEMIMNDQIETVPVSDEDYEDSSVTTDSQMEEDEIPDSRFPEQLELKGYLLINMVGEGAFSAVFRGVPDKTSSQSFLSKSFSEVAIKVIRKKEVPTAANEQNNNNNKSATKEQVLKEVKIHMLSSSGEACENIVKFIDFQESEHYYYIIQELMGGGEIFGEIVKYTYFSEDLSRHVIRQLAVAVKHLHSMGIVHRDIKPENLLFEPIKFMPSATLKLRKSDDPNTKIDEGEFQPFVGGGGIGMVKLADFGLSKQIYESNTKTPCGTVGYTAPEVVKDERYSMKVDMWGIGCVLYTLLCGFPPFYDEKIDTLTEKISRGEYSFLRPWWDEISSGAKNCVRKLLEVDPEKRYGIDDLLKDQWLNSFDSINNDKSSTLHQKRKSKNHYYHKKKVAILNKDTSLLYSPAANAMRDAFDVSNAVQRRQNEKREDSVPKLFSLAEDEEDFQFNMKKNNNLEENMFQLSLNSSTILKRRNDNQVVNNAAQNIAISTLIE